MTDNMPRSKSQVTLIRITELIDSPWQGRFDALMAQQWSADPPADIQELAHSIETSGLMQPILVRKAEQGYEIIDGHRRVRAMRQLGRGQIMAIVRECSDREAQVMHVVSNLQRKNLKPVELAVTYQKLLETKVFKDKRELSQAIGKDETYVGDLLATLQLDSRIIADLTSNNLVKDLRILRLIRLYSPADNNGVSNAQWELYRKVLLKKMSRRDLSDLIKKNTSTAFLSSWKVKSSARKITIMLETSYMDRAKKETIIRLIDEKMEEIKKQL